MEKDTRPVKCFVCGKKMYYSGHPKCEPEYRISDDGEESYVHVSCIKTLRQLKRKLKQLEK